MRFRSLVVLTVLLSLTAVVAWMSIRLFLPQRRSSTCVDRILTTVGGGLAKPLLQIAIVRLARSQVEAPAVVADHDVNVIR
jgi:hypothetical protein